MKYCVGTPNRGYFLKPTVKWDGDFNFEFKIKRRADSDFTGDPDRHQSINSTFVCSALITTKSCRQGCVTLGECQKNT